MSDEIQPALTPEEWAKRLYYVRDEQGRWLAIVGVTADADGDRLDVSSSGPDGAVFVGPQRRALAALALHAQPFGFTHADLAVIDEAMQDSYYADNESSIAGSPPNTVPDRLEALRARIAALLPPPSA